MKVGLIVPQGWHSEFKGFDDRAAWLRTVEIAKLADARGFESIWVYDHFHTVPDPTDESVFESFTGLAALAAETKRVRLGHIVICTAFRNPALTAKMISTLDSISGGRADLGIGAGWKREEWLAYGYGFPETKVRLATLRDHLEVITRMLEAGDTNRAHFEGQYASVTGAINRPKPIQKPRIPVMVGGNGPNVTWRLAAKFADEINLDGKTPAEVAEAMPIIAARCEEIGRDPATLKVSEHTSQERPVFKSPGSEQADAYAAYRELGVYRIQSFLHELAAGDEAIYAFEEDLRAAGAEFEATTS